MRHPMLVGTLVGVLILLAAYAHDRVRNPPLGHVHQIGVDALE